MFCYMFGYPVFDLLFLETFDTSWFVRQEEGHCDGRIVLRHTKPGTSQSVRRRRFLAEKKEENMSILHALWNSR